MTGKLDRVRELWDVDPEDYLTTPTPLEEVRYFLIYYIAMGLLSVANLLFVRPVERMYGLERCDRSAWGLLKALHRNDRIDRWGIDGFARVVGFGEYLGNADTEGRMANRMDFLAETPGWNRGE